MVLVVFYSENAYNKRNSQEKGKIKLKKIKTVITAVLVLLAGILLVGMVIVIFICKRKKR